MRPGDATLGVEQHAVPAPTDPPGHAGQEVGLGVQIDRLALARRERIDHVALDVGPQRQSLDADHPARSKLVIAADLAAANQPRAGIYADDVALFGEMVERIGLRNVLAAPAGADLRADVAAGPGV